MAKERIEHACGCVLLRPVYGPDHLKTQKIASLARDICPRCAHKKKEAELEAAGELPVLIGPEVHVRWGTQVRDRLVQELETYIAKSVQVPPGEQDYIDKLLARARGRKDAGFWWDMRGVGARSLFATLQAEMARELEELERLEFRGVSRSGF